MPLSFNATGRAPTVGVELELQLVDAHTRDLLPVVDDVIDGLQRTHPGSERYIHRELFTNTLELVTGVCPTIDAAVRDLEQSMAQVREVAAGVGHPIRLMAAGAHPFAHWRDQQITDTTRMRGLVEHLQLPVRRLLTFGLHVHVCVPDGDSAMRSVDVLSRHLPLFIALSASSPYWNGVDTGLASYRAIVFESLPLTGLPPEVHTWKEYERSYDAFLRAGWATAHKDLHWDVRPSPAFGTVELRVCDAVPTMLEVGALSALTQCLVTAGETAAVLPRLPRHVHEQNKWQAQRFELDGRIMVTPDGDTAQVRDVVETLLDRLGDTAEHLGCTGELRAVRTVMRAGASSRRQRRAYAGHNHDAPAALRAVVDSLCAELESGIPWAGIGPESPR